jgi:UDP-glucose 4-epimerase
VTWLITGGAGYIGSHIVLRLVESGYQVVVIDDLSTGRRHRIPSNVKFVEGDILDVEFLKSVLLENKVTGVIHLAGKKSVMESFNNPEDYFKTNVIGTINLLNACEATLVKCFIFSSTAAVYEDPKSELALSEGSPIYPTSPYGESKQFAEKAILERSNRKISIVIFRYFNVTGLLKPDLAESDAPNLVPVVERAIVNDTPVEIYGSDHHTRDGTCIRDYVHVVDIAEAHLAAIKLIETSTYTRTHVVNLGTGTGYSVLEVIDNLENLYKTKIERIFLEKRPGEPSVIICNPGLAKTLLGWEVARNPFSGVRTSSN